MSTISRISSPPRGPQIRFLPPTQPTVSLSIFTRPVYPAICLQPKCQITTKNQNYGMIIWRTKSSRPKGRYVGARTWSEGPPRLKVCIFSPFFIFPQCSSYNFPSSLHERLPSSKGVSDISTTQNHCSSLFWERLLLWCRQGFLSSGTLVLQHPDLCRTKDRISCLLPPDFLLRPFHFFFFGFLHFSVWKMGHWICWSNTWAKFGVTGEWKKLLHWYSATHPLELNHVVHKCSRSMGKRTGIGV